MLIYFSLASAFAKASFLISSAAFCIIICYKKDSILKNHLKIKIVTNNHKSQILGVKIEKTTFLPLLDGIFPFQNNFKDLDPSCKMDLDLWHCFGILERKVHFIVELHKTR